MSQVQVAFISGRIREAPIQIKEFSKTRKDSTSWTLKRLETVQASLQQNTKIVVPANQELVNVIGDMAGIVPLKPGAAKSAGQ